MSILYYVYLLFIIIFLLFIIKKSFCIHAVKVRIYIQISLILFFIRYLILIIFRISKGTWHLYMLKPYIFINTLAIINLSIMFFYIFLKNNSKDFKFNYILALAFTGSYITMYKFLKPKIIYDRIFGYIASDFSNITKVSLAYLVILSLFIIIAILCIDKKNVDSNKLFILILVLSLVIIDNVMYLGGLRLLPYVMVSDTFVILLTDNVIGKLNKKCNDVKVNS